MFGENENQNKIYLILLRYVGTKVENLLFGNRAEVNYILVCFSISHSNASISSLNLNFEKIRIFLLFKHRY